MRRMGRALGAQAGVRRSGLRRSSGRPQAVPSPAVGLRPPSPVGEDFDLLQRDETVGDHGVELGQDGSQSVLLVDDLDQDGQVLREAQDARRVQVGLGAVALDPAQDRDAGDAPAAEMLDDGLVERRPSW